MPGDVPPQNGWSPPTTPPGARALTLIRGAGQQTGRVDYGTIVGTFADLFLRIERLHAEGELAAVDCDQLGAGADVQTKRAGGQMAHVEMGADRRLTRRQSPFDSETRGVFHQRDHRWRREHLEAS